MAQPGTLATNRNPMDEAVVPTDQALVPVTPEGEMLEEAKKVDERDFLDMLLELENIAQSLDDEQLNEIADICLTGYDIDKQSRADWEQNYGEAMELARQLYEKKTWAGHEVANIKYPILSTAAIHFSSRSYGNLVKGENYVSIKVYGRDPQGKKAERADRVKMHMNYQLGTEMDSWEEDTDQMLMSLPLIGTGFKKTFHDHNRNVNRSIYVSAEDLVVNYWASSLETAARVTHIIELTQNEVIERIRNGLYLDIEDELQSPTVRDASTTIDDKEQPEQGDEAHDEDAPHVFLEQHCWYDLDEDGYKEPYVITIHKESQRIVRVVARFDSDGIEKNEKGEIVRIEPIHYFTQYSFFPAFDGNFYRLGFGILLAPINRTVNTVINQLLDAGTLANRQSGFINQGLRLTKSGETGYFRIKPGEWKFVQSPGDDIRKNIFPIPIKEPSTTLFQLLGLMLEASERLASQADVLSGEQNQPNVPATSTLALIEQGLKVYSSIYKRIYRAMKQELKKLRRLNYLYTDNEIYNKLIDADPNEYASVKLDYADTDLDLNPVSGSADVSDVQRLIKAQALIEVSEKFGLDQKKVGMRYMEALDIPNAGELWPEQPPPNYQLQIAEKQLLQVDAQIQQKERELDIREFEARLKEVDTLEKSLKTHTDAIKNIAVAESMEQGNQLDQYRTEVDAFFKGIQAMKLALEARAKQNEPNQGTANQSAGATGAGQGANPVGGTTP